MQSTKSHLFHDETLASFFRRLAWSPDGSFLLVPAGIGTNYELQIYEYKKLSRNVDCLQYLALINFLAKVPIMLKQSFISFKMVAMH